METDELARALRCRAVSRVSLKPRITPTERHDAQLDNRAADALEAQAKRIAELEAERDEAIYAARATHKSAAARNREEQARAEAAEAKVARLRDALMNARAELEAYEEAATGEAYNNPTLNAALQDTQP